MGFWESLCARAVYDSIKKVWTFIACDGEKRNTFENKIWRGSFTQNINDAEESFDVAFTFNIERKILTAIAQYRTGETDRNLDLIGGFHDRQLIFLQYTSSNDESFHKGFILFKLNNQGNTLTGKYMGIGIKTEEIVSGKIILERNT